jgi:16S rRNA (guanine966-N2)-methyltransferase
MPDRLRETLFNILGRRVTQKIFLDLYAGSGAVGLEALSRGAQHVIFVEESRATAKIIQKNIDLLRVQENCSLVLASTKAALPKIAGDIYFLGPPYPLPDEYDTTLSALGDRHPDLVIAQHARNHNLAECYSNLKRVRIVTQGSNSLSFFDHVGMQ